MHEDGFHTDVPEAFTSSPAFRTFLASVDESRTSGAPENMSYLDPRPGMRSLDAGCSANLAAYRLDRWHATYYGVDIMPFSSDDTAKRLDAV